jgi:peptidoglycan/LPS O-acetylase OafA/YrhL
MRAIAALLVLIDHTFASLTRDKLIFSDVVWYESFFGQIGTLGVAIFFVISGFIMTDTNVDGFGSAYSAKHFFVRRILRIVPIYYIATAFAFAVLVSIPQINISAADLLSSIAFIPHFGNLENPGFFPVLGVGWTLNMEMLFYALFAIALILKKRIGIAFLLISILSIVFVSRILVFMKVDEHNIAHFYSELVMLLFAAGVIISLKLDLVNSFFSKYLKLLRYDVLIGITIALIALLNAVRVNRGLIHLMLDFASIPIMAAALCRPAALPDFIRRRLVLIGDASYSLYLFHSSFLIVLNRIWRDLHIGNALFLSLANLVITLALSIGAYFLLEMPIRKYMEYPLRRRLEARTD